jgi:UPF0755 protein|tara:strand:- start:2285 stop:3313 length:1029 start_codon:yes stop_codon:yes gene_type:complete
MNKQKIIFLISTLVFIIGAVSYNYYQNIFGELVIKDGAIYIGSHETIYDVEKELSDFIGDDNNFNWLAQQKKYENPKAGKYILTKEMSLNDVINLLRSGNQTPVKVSFNNQDTLEKFSGRISTQIEADSITILKIFKDPVFLKDNKLTESSVLGILIPNTYEFYWNTSAENFRNNLLKEYTKFWNEDRLAKASALKMSPEEVITLASIVQKETAKTIERPNVAGLYLNRIKRGIPLQADPTIIYILKQQHGQNFQVKRVLYKDLKISSPFNTYLNRGLPPSLISMPDISSIDAVLNYKKHNYIYMCASIKKIGFHEFSSTLKQHNSNAVKYQRWLTKQGINR